MKALEFCGAALIVILACLAVMIGIAVHFGWRFDAVLSRSMEPELRVGELAVTRPLGQATIAVGDIITFYEALTGRIATHRVVEVVSASAQYYRTKGDTNELADLIYVPRDAVIGKICFSLPYAGYISQLKNNLPLSLMAMYLPGLTVIALEMRNIWRVFIEQSIEKRYRIG